MSNYSEQLRRLDSGAEVDLTFWRYPEGAEIPGDPLKFLYVPDAVGQRMVAQLADDVREYRTSQNGQGFETFVMVTMGALYPGVLLADHLSHDPDLQSTVFGTIGAKCYANVGIPMEIPEIVQGNE